MHHHMNHCWCSSAEHSHDFYDARNMVDIDSLEHDQEDWDKMITVGKIVSADDKRMYEGMEEKLGVSFEQMWMKDCPYLNQEVIDWLNENVNPQKDGEPGWAIGDEQYRLIQGYRLTIWFIRKSDAKKFIKAWSKYGKATSYYNHFDDTNIVLDLETGKYKNRHGNN